MKLKIGLLTIVFTTMLCSESNISKEGIVEQFTMQDMLDYKLLGVDIKFMKNKQSFKIFIDNIEYRVIKVKGKFKVFKNIERKEKILKIIEKYKRSLENELELNDLILHIGPGSTGIVENSSPDLPPCEIFNKDKIELFTFLGLESPESNRLPCKEEKDVIDVNLSKDSNSSKDGIRRGKK